MGKIIENKKDRIAFGILLFIISLVAAGICFYFVNSSIQDFRHLNKLTSLHPDDMKIILRGAGFMLALIISLGCMCGGAYAALKD